MIKTLRFYIGLFLPSIAFIALGIVWLNTAFDKIYDPKNYLTPSQMPLAQEYATLKLILGICVGVFIGVTIIYLSTYFERPGKKWKSWWFWVWVVELGFAANLIGGFPNSNFHLTPQKEVAIAWAPFRITFTASLFISYGLGFAVLLITKMIQKRKNS